MKYFIKANESGTIYWLIKDQPNSGNTYSWTSDPKNKYIIRFKSEEEANKTLTILGYPTKDNNEAYYCYVEPETIQVEEKPIRNTSSHIYVKDIKGKKRAMSLEKFTGILFTNCFNTQQYKIPQNRNNLDHTYTTTFEVGYVYDDSITYSITITKRLKKINNNCFVIDILDGPREDSRVVYRIQLDYMVPTLIENHITTPFMRKCFQ